ncbi:hypothetical protein IU486_04240 [Streptomyces gardneri]|uniref:hypothetical protein n=1 Tax=Nocardia sputi TaxID=2943705 RepID=UPI001895527B|nr:hypothetical protein [Nocardia sputi]MBF6163984.1 hypothetical protein [Streptomyces gardneri]
MAHLGGSVPAEFARVCAVIGPAGSPRPEEPDVHLSVYLHDQRMDFAACLTAAVVFVQEWNTHHRPDAVTVLPGDTTGLPRLPCERLYLEP